GKLIKCQVKGTKNIEFKNGDHTLQIKTSTWNNWSNYQMPVIALLCDINTENIYWCLPLSFEPKKDSKTVSLKFSYSNILASKFELFKGIIESWSKSFPSKNILLTLPYFHDLFESRIMDYAGWGDPWCAVEPEDSMVLKLFYFHVLELRSSVGLRNDFIFPFHYWMIRNQGIWEDGVSLFNGTYDEIANYLKPFYEEAIEKIKTRLSKVSTKFEHLELINYFKLHSLLQGNNNVSIDIKHPSSEDEAFHKMMENALSRVGMKKYKWRKKTDDNKA
ncbi:MAG: DUF4365 domain-containing protein, partial [Bacteroidota bacterium]